MVVSVKLWVLLYTCLFLLKLGTYVKDENFIILFYKIPEMKLDFYIPMYILGIYKY